MRSFAFIIAVSLLLATTASAQSSQGKDIDVQDGAELTVTKVLNGHELQGKLADGTRVTVRVIGLDCPDKTLGKTATAQAKKLLEKKKVSLESSQSMFPLAQDNFGRVVGYVRLQDGSDFAEQLLGAGQCTASTWSIPHPRKSTYASLR